LSKSVTVGLGWARVFTVIFIIEIQFVVKIFGKNSEEKDCFFWFPVDYAGIVTLGIFFYTGENFCLKIEKFKLIIAILFDSRWTHLHGYFDKDGLLF